MDTTNARRQSKSYMMSLIDLGKQLLEYAKQGDTDEVRTLMSNGAPFTTDWLGTSPLHMAAQYGHARTAEVLLRAGISRDARTKVDRTALHVASQEGYEVIVEMLIKHGADIEAKDMLLMTPLHWAVERSHLPVINTLLTYNADIYSKNKFNKTPLDIAEENSRMDIFQILQENVAFRKENPHFVQKKPRMQTKSPRLILPKPQALPLVNIKKDATSSISDIVNQTVTQKIPSNSNSPIGTANVMPKTFKASHPIVLLKEKTPNILQRGVKTTSLETSDNDPTDQSCTNVLATLAALAEATAPNATISTQEAVQWLELHGITMLPSDNSTIVATALEGGQSVSLTEAGKLALTWVKENKHFGANSPGKAVSTQEKISNKPIVPSNQKLITIVTDKGKLPSIMTTQKPPIVLLSSQNINSGTKCDQQLPLKIKTQVERNSNGKVTTLSCDDERLLLEKELEKMKKEAAEYKAQLQKKEHEAEEYRKQLEKLKKTS